MSSLVRDAELQLVGVGAIQLVAQLEQPGVLHAAELDGTGHHVQLGVGVRPEEVVVDAQRGRGILSRRAAGRFLAGAVPGDDAHVAGIGLGLVVLVADEQGKLARRPTDHAPRFPDRAAVASSASGVGPRASVTVISEPLPATA